jgi:hypothetical protein
MTYFLNFRSSDVNGGVTDPLLYEGDGITPGALWKPIQGPLIQQCFAGQNILFATHGFNVNKTDGAKALGLLDQYLALTAPNVFVGMLWPGDFYIPFVNYPFEDAPAEDCGRRLAAFCLTSCATAQSISFASHSLGARLVLQAAASLKGLREVQSICLAAAAVNCDCLTTEYADAAANSERIYVLASNDDLVLKLAYPPGDQIANLLHSDHNPFAPALGAGGPPTPTSPPIVPPWQIGNQDGYDHLDYLPPTGLTAPLIDPTKWPRVADFIKRAFLGQPQTWPS